MWTWIKRLCPVLLLCACSAVAPPGDDAGLRAPPPDGSADVPPDLGEPDLGVPDLATAASSLVDYLIQDVCAGADDVALPVDPYDGCPAGAQRRDLKLGEALPYHRHDQPDGNNPLGFQRHDSFPLAALSGDGRAMGLRAVNPFDFPPFGEYNSNDGYDVIEADGTLAAIVGTRDPGGLAQTFFGAGCALADSWLLAPTVDFLQPGSKVAMLRGVGWERAGQPFPGTCPAGLDAAYTDWQVLPGFPFGGQGGARDKRIDAILSQHYGGRDPATADHIEKFYLTRLYGLTRWERWQSKKTQPGAQPKAAGCGGVTSAGDFVRVDCRDWSQVIPEPQPYPPMAWPTPYAAGNLVPNGDFGAASVAGWQRLGQSQDGRPTNWSLLQDAGSGTYLATNCGGPCTPGQSLLVDVPLRGVAAGARFRFGARVATAAGSGAAELVVFQRDAAAAIIERDGLTVTATAAGARLSSGAFTVQPGTTQLRLQFYLNAPATFYLDDVWLAASP